MITKSLERLRTAGVRVFGSEEHRFHLNPPLSELVVSNFERVHNVRLPNDYRYFLTNLGNGGAGPFYGIFRLGEMDDNFEYRTWTENDGMIGNLASPFRMTMEWNDLTGKPADDLLDDEAGETSYDIQQEAFTQCYWDGAIIDGSIPICHEGCALRILLVLSGPQAGYLWRDSRSEFTGVAPLSLDDGSPATFSTWYQEWLQTSLRQLQS